MEWVDVYSAIGAARRGTSDLAVRVAFLERLAARGLRADGWRIRDISKLLGWKFNHTREVVAPIDKR